LYEFSFLSVKAFQSFSVVFKSSERFLRVSFSCFIDIASFIIVIEFLKILTKP